MQQRPVRRKPASQNPPDDCPHGTAEEHVEGARLGGRRISIRRKGRLTSREGTKTVRCGRHHLVRCRPGLPGGLTCDPFRLPEANVDLVLRTVPSGAGEVLGGLVFGPAATLSQDPEIELQLTALEGLAALAIEQSHLAEELNYRLEHDSLTGLYDRLSVERRMSEALVRSAHSGACVALLVLAIDRF